MAGVRSVLATIVVVALVGAVAPAALAGGPIAVERGGDLFTYRPHAGLTRLTSSVRHEDTPTWSPDHRRIAFVGGNRTLIWLDTLTGIRHRVAHLPPRFERIGAVAWSPDGGRVAFSTSTLTGEHRLCGQVWTAPAFGRGPPTKLLGAQAMVTGLAWGPDGTWLLASAEWVNGIRVCGPAARTGILRFDADGTHLTVVADTTANMVDLSEAGTLIVYRGWMRTCHACGEIWRSAAEGSHAHVIAMPRGDAFGLYEPRFDPAAARVAFLTGRHGHRSLWIMRADGSHRHLVLQHADGLDW
ncbi:MAG: TolB family protein [Actinomycetota bacterium]